MAALHTHAMREHCYGNVEARMSALSGGIRGVVLSDNDRRYQALARVPALKLHFIA